MSRTCTVPGQQPEDRALVVGGQVGQDLRNVGVGKPRKHETKLRPVLLGDQFLDLDLHKVSEHGRCRVALSGPIRPNRAPTRDEAGRSPASSPGNAGNPAGRE
jgi:hypothetical protein